jgi:hypothetical protein
MRPQGVSHLTRHCEKATILASLDTLDCAAIRVCEDANGACFGYLQSDEISVLLTDVGTPTTQAWFDGNLQETPNYNRRLLARISRLAVGNNPLDYALIHAIFQTLRNADFNCDVTP